MQKVQMVVTGEFENAEKSREAINLAARYFKKRNLTLHQVSDVPGVSTQELETAKKVAQEAAMEGQA